MDIQVQLQELSLNPVILISVIVVIIVIVVVIILVDEHKQYKQYIESTYYQITKNPYSSIKYDMGKYGEYLIYKSLKHFENNGDKFLFNIYIPKGKYKTTEIDVLLICSKGLFVFESKNYSGWIFGNESQRNWTQVLPKGRGYSHKEHFYNPIMQNALHIKHLKNLVGENIPIYSIIVFSDECTLKDITIKSDDISVINLYNLEPVVMKICNQIQTDLLTETEVNDIYNRLYPYTQVSYEVKVQHIENIRKDARIRETNLSQSYIDNEDKDNFLNKGIYKR